MERIRSAFQGVTVTTLEDWFNLNPDFDPWSPDRYRFKEDLRRIRDGGRGSPDANLASKSKQQSFMPVFGLTHVTPACASPPKCPSDGSVSTDRPEDLQAVKVNNRLHVFVKAANSPDPVSVSRVTALLDSGAEPNCISEEFANRAGAVMKPGPTALLSADGKRMETVGDVKLNVAWLNGEDINHAKISCHVVRGLRDDIILSEQTVCRHGLRDVAASSLDPVPTVVFGNNVSPIKLSKQSKRKAEEDLSQLKEKQYQAIAREKAEAAKRVLQREQMAPTSSGVQRNFAITVNSGMSSSSTSTTATSQTSAQTAASSGTSVTAPTSVPSSPQSTGKP